MKQKLIFLFLSLAICVSATAQNFPVHSVSARLGVPVSITYKQYMTRKAALEFGIGSVSPFWANHYYINSFNSFDRYKNFDYVDHNVHSTLYLQARYLKDFPIPTTGMEGALNWYCGIGAVLKISPVTYTYTNVDAIPVVQSDRRTDIDFGPEAILGAEYWLQDTPFSFYGEGSAMLEVADRVTGRAFAAVGVRFHFMP